jgi:glycosyltransferase involved in cell wall biosynthesis
LAAQPEISNKVKFLGKIVPEELHQVTVQAMVGINMLDAVSLSYQYSLANKFFDYVQANVPVICSDFVEYRKLNEQYEVAVLCDYEPLAIRNAIKLLLTNPEHYQKLADNCKLAAAHWHWQTQEQKLAQIYSDIV